MASTNEMMGQWLMGLKQRNMLGTPEPAEREPTPTKPGTVVASADADLAATVAASLATKAKAQPPEPRPKATGPTLRELEERAERYARELAAPPPKRAPDPEVVEAQRKADQRSGLLRQAVETDAARREQKARRRAAKALRRFGL